MTLRTTPVQDVWKCDPQFRDALARIKKCAEVALSQGPLSRRNALGEIAEMATAATRADGEAPSAKEDDNGSSK